MHPEHLKYFKDLFEGCASVSWNAWFKRHEAQLAQDLPRAAFLRLKFDKLDEAEKILREAGVAFSMSPLAKREKYYSLLHESVLNDDGRPNEAFRKKAYDGAIGQFLDGQSAKAKDTLANFLRKLKRRDSEARIEEIEALCFDGEMEFLYGDRELGQLLLESVAQVAGESDLLDHVISRARELLGS